jgi:hypothetical protein
VYSPTQALEHTHRFSFIYRFSKDVTSIDYSSIRSDNKATSMITDIPKLFATRPSFTGSQTDYVV